MCRFNNPSKCSLLCSWKMMAHISSVVTITECGWYVWTEVKTEVLCSTTFIYALDVSYSANPVVDKEMICSFGFWPNREFLNVILSLLFVGTSWRTSSSTWHSRQSLRFRNIFVDWIAFFACSTFSIFQVKDFDLYFLEFCNSNEFL